MDNIERKCRRIWFMAVHVRDRHCQISGESDDKHSHHLFGRHNWVLAFDVDFGACFNTHYHRMLHGVAGLQHGTPTEQKLVAMRKFIGRLLIFDRKRAEKILHQADRPCQKIVSPCWPDVLNWVTEQYQKIEDEQRYDEDIEPAYGRTVP